ncbi:MAG: GNAT family N-acetyltransferase [Candidatus Merdivicinus sp.]|jgi:diamine N-acetyltransferase
MEPFVSLKNITPDNIEEVLKLKVSKEQEDFVPTTAHALAKAWAYYNTAFPFAIYAGDTLVGFIMMGYYERKRQYTVWYFLIDERYQHQGYGRAALKLGVQFLIDRFHVNEVYIGVRFGNTVAHKLYASFGFSETSDITDTGFEMKLVISEK